MQQPDYDAELYSDATTYSFPIVTSVLNVYNMTFEAAPEQPSEVNGRGTLEPFQFLDVGCGCGSLTRKILLPSCPDSVHRIVGVDICSNMVSFARERNAHPKLAYEELDISGDVSLLLEKYGRFDRIYSINRLNRVKNQAAAWRNMQTLLKPGGECLLFYCAWYMTPEIWRELAKKDRWCRFSEVSEKLQNLHLAVLTALIPGIQSLTHTERQVLMKDTDEEIREWQASRKNSPLTDNYIIHAVKPQLKNTQENLKLGLASHFN
ncbi:hypothetical protein MTO96_005972 [Rhipicephalus appendiculatus]